MVSLLWMIVMWFIVFYFIPHERLKQIWPAAVISFFWLLLLDHTFVKLHYYSFPHGIFPIGGVPFFYLLGGAAGGLLFINFVQPNPLYKILLVTVFSTIFAFEASIFARLKSFVFLNGFNHTFNFVLNIAGLSFLIWWSLGLLGGERIYRGPKIRRIKFFLKSWK